ncbi:MAG: hypothetical protein KatS3mg104_3116 [Phycisphaerae bacterium]|jgi:tetratricopeptide (TPR) repeat protein|nr:MAG: hypothetical protein KatS3mg104_3116 [Phycisphaerae bacterium]
MSRLEQLHRLLEKSPEDPFLTYGIALEHKKQGEFDQAVEWLDRTIRADANYCYAYYQKGQVLEQLGRIEDARKAYRAGIEAARRVGDAHAEGEIAGAEEMLG